nr:MAG TPA: hypothetical protein [Caudoviricetes sp.]
MYKHEQFRPIGQLCILLLANQNSKFEYPIIFSPPRGIESYIIICLT